MPHTRKGIKITSENYYWQPDHDLDGIGDSCDSDTAWISFKGTPVNKEFKEKDYAGSNEAFTFYDTYSNHMLSVSIDSKSTWSTYSGDYNATSRFCWLTPDEYNENKWGTEGKCTTEAKFNPQGCKMDFGYSHGSDPKPTIPVSEFEFNISWKKSTFDSTPEHTLIKRNTGKTVTWNWRQDFIGDNDTFRDDLDDIDVPFCTEYDYVSEECKDTSISRFYYSLSTGIRGDNPETNQYLVETVNPAGGNENINPVYFRNQQRYARTERLSKDPVEVSYYYYKRGSPNDLGQIYCLGVPCNRPVDGLQKFIIEKFREIVTGPSVFERPGMEHFFNNDYGSDFIKSGLTLSEWNMNGSGNPSVKIASRPQNLLTVTKNIEGANIGLSIVPQGSMQFMGYNPESTTGTFYQIVQMDINSNGDWRTTGIISDIPENFNPVTSTSHNGNLYVVSREKTNAAILKNVYVIAPVELNGNTCSGSDNIFVPELIGSLPDLSNITIYSFNDSLIAVGEGGNGMEVYKFTEYHGDRSFNKISGSVMPSMRDVYSVEIKDGVLYLAGGIQIEGSFIDFKTDIWKFTEPSGWSLIRNDLNLFPVSFKIDFNGTDIILTDRIFKADATTERIKFNADGTGITPAIETVPVEGVPIDSYGNLCLNETDDVLKGGMSASGTCIPFTHPWYRQFSAGATVYSVAGKGDRLYVGTSSSIKVYDISDPAAMTLKYTFSTSNRIVYDLEIADGDIMYAATSKGLYKLSTANPNSLSVIGSFYSTGSYNYQYKIQLYNDKLYVGDDNGINIRDKNTFARLAYVNTGSILDFAIADGEIAMYWSAFWDEGIQIRDADTLNMKAYDYATCYTGELTADHGEFYLSCDDYEYRFMGLPNTYLDYFPVDGDIREMQENYAYNGWAYIPDGSYVKQSTSNDVPAICGNGVTEPGELCDGNSVECTTLDPEYIGGTAACNSTCNGYNEVNCEVDGW